MIKLERYTGEKTYMFPNGAIATPEVMAEQFPAALAYTHIIETDEQGQVCWAVENLSAMRSMHNIDASLNEDEAIAALEDMRNAPPADDAPGVEERIAAALEYQNLLNS